MELAKIKMNVHMIMKNVMKAQVTIHQSRPFPLLNSVMSRLTHLKIYPAAMNTVYHDLLTFCI